MRFIPILLLFTVLLTNCDDCPPPVMEPCGIAPERPLVDLIVLIDNSGSMSRAATTLSNAAAMAIDSSLNQCNTDLRVSFLGVDGVWPSTNFSTSHRQFIYQAQGGTVPLSSDGSTTGLATELGAHAIEDLSEYTNWREGACRAIFYISDEELDGFSPIGDVANEDATTAGAIAAANDNGVTVFTNYILENMRGPSILQNYDDLTMATGGFNQVTASMADVDIDLYLDLMPRVICNACTNCQLQQLEP